MTQERIKGPCYPNWPSMNSARVHHVRSEDGQTCQQCGLPWTLPDEAE